MKRKNTTSRATKRTSINADLARLWRAADHIVQHEKQGLLDRSMRASVSSFIDASIELASAALIEPKDDPAPLIRAAQLGLERAIQILPSIDDCLDDMPLSAKAAKTWQVALVRDALKISRAFSGATNQQPSAQRSGDVYEPYLPKRAADLENPDPSKLWMVEQLWQRNGTGIIGGGAKGCKTWLALDIALSVASGTRALDRFDVHQPGGVLYINAEGGEAYFKDRVSALCAHRGLDLDSLPHELHVIPNAIRIDTPAGLGRLEATIQAFTPTLVILDPLVRLHRLDENSASSISGLLSSLTELQQSLGIALILVHHSKKQNASSEEMTGRDIRGSGDLHAWGSSNIFMRRKGNRVIVSAEHRAAPSGDKWTLRTTSDEYPRLEIVRDDEGDDSADAGRDGSNGKLDTDIFELLHNAPQSGREVRAKVPGGTERILASLKRLEAQKRIVRVGRRWTVANGSPPRSRAW